ncbi:hypothetical protein ACETU7_08340 [Rhodococcus sp. 3Y1]
MNVEPDAEVVAGAVLVELAGVVLLGAGELVDPPAHPLSTVTSCRADYSCGSRTDGYRSLNAPLAG